MHHLSTHLLPLRLAGEEKPLNTSQPLLLRQKPGRVEVEPSCDNDGGVYHSSQHRTRQTLANTAELSAIRCISQRNHNLATLVHAPHSISRPPTVRSPPPAMVISITLPSNNTANNSLLWVRSAASQVRAVQLSCMHHGVPFTDTAQRMGSALLHKQHSSCPFTPP